MGEIVAELLVGLVAVALGFLLLWLWRGDAAFDIDATTAWGVGVGAITLFGCGFLATRDVLITRRRRRLGF